nr:MAG: hypothetical protein [Bacteriophage sp.]
MAITWSKSPVEIVKDLIATKNPNYDALRDQFTLSAVQASALENHDAAVVLSPVDTTKYKDPTTYNYVRKGLAAYVSDVLAVANATFAWAGTPVLTDTSSAEDLLAVVNSVLGLGLAADDVVITSAVVTSGEAYTLTVAATETNYAFSGTVVITVTQAVTVASVAPETDLGSL